MDFFLQFSITVYSTQYEPHWVNAACNQFHLMICQIFKSSKFLFTISLPVTRLITKTINTCNQILQSQNMDILKLQKKANYVTGKNLFIIWEVNIQNITGWNLTNSQMHFSLSSVFIFLYTNLDALLKKKIDIVIKSELAIAVYPVG